MRMCTLLFILFVRTPQKTAKKKEKKRKKRKKRKKLYDILPKVRGTKDQPIDQRANDYLVHVWTRELSPLTSEIRHGASRSDPHETRVSQGQSECVGSGRFGSGRVRRCSKSRGSGRVGSRYVKKIAGRVGPGDPTREVDPTHEV